MKLVIDTRNGLAGDIMAAGLIGLGADPLAITGAMESAGELLGGATVKHFRQDGVHRLNISAPAMPNHLHASEAVEYLGSSLQSSNIRKPWSEMGFKVLNALIEAEGHVHSTHPELRKHFHGDEPVLHEASDIIMDITGMAVGMMALDILSVEYIESVNVGGGKVEFSHGTLDVPTPATRQILDSHGISWHNSDAGMEMTTPTGAAILAGCGATKTMEFSPTGRKSMAGGTRPLPPVPFLLSE